VSRVTKMTIHRAGPVYSHFSIDEHRAGPVYSLVLSSSTEVVVQYCRPNTHLNYMLTDWDSTMLDGREFQSSTTLCEKKNLQTFILQVFLNSFKCSS